MYTTFSDVHVIDTTLRTAFVALHRSSCDVHNSLDVHSWCTQLSVMYTTLSDVHNSLMYTTLRTVFIALHRSSCDIHNSQWCGCIARATWDLGPRSHKVPCVAVCCSVSQCVVVCCSVLQCVLCVAVSSYETYSWPKRVVYLILMHHRTAFIALLMYTPLERDLCIESLY